MPRNILRIGGSAMSKGIWFYGPNYGVGSYDDGNLKISKARKLPAFIKKIPVFRFLVYLLLVLIRNIKDCVLIGLVGMSSVIAFQVVYFFIFPEDNARLMNITQTAEDVQFLRVFSNKMQIGGLAVLLLLIRSSVYIYAYRDKPVLNFLAKLPFIRYFHDLFTYHGAEHKTISYYEHCGAEGLKTIDMPYLKSLSTIHPRCGTNFLPILLSVIFVFEYFVPIEIVWYWDAIITFLLYGVAGEIFDLVVRLNFRLLLWPGMLIQRYFTTYEPSEAQLRTGIRGITALLAKEEENI